MDELNHVSAFWILLSFSTNQNDQGCFHDALVQRPADTFLRLDWQEGQRMEALRLAEQGGSF
ncbi:hypothetical protein [Ensifer aridi]|uniref:hypothetical protein n=1 Tax=Ensifer aridi TaxID=1708715 RepID=UPI00111C1CC6|nr:hypothetical protein [Ensifer aridi]